MRRKGEGAVVGWSSSGVWMVGWWMPELQGYDSRETQLNQLARPAVNDRYTAGNNLRLL